MGRGAVLLVILLCYHLKFADRIQCTPYLSKEEDAAAMDVKLKLLNRGLTNNIQTSTTPLHYKESRQDLSIPSKSFDKNSKADESCPKGIVPLRRITNELIREHQAVESANITDSTNRPNTFLAIARTKVGPVKYTGGGGGLKTENPKAIGQQYTATRIRIQGGVDSIEAGWRVDPALYGDSQTRFFIRTDAGQTHCFNTHCSGFIQTNHDFDLEGVIETISPPGGPVWSLPCHIIRNNTNGNWNLWNGESMVGYWPSSIFTGLRGLANRVEWGGAAYSPPGTPLPSMGSSNLPIGNPDWDGSIFRIQVLNERGQPIDRFDVETYATNPKLYSVQDDGYRNKRYGHIILYGGPGHL